MALKSNRRFRFSVKQLFVAVFCLAVVFGIWQSIGGPVTIRPSVNTDRIYDDYFGISSDKTRLRNIAVIEGVFSRGNALTAALYSIEGGKVTELNAFSVCRSPNRLGEWNWKQMRITLAIGDRETPHGIVSELGSFGQSRGGGRGGGEVAHHIASTHASTLTGYVPQGPDFVIHAEGDQLVDLEPGTTMEEFLLRNQGNYLVVTARFH